MHKTSTTQHHAALQMQQDRIVTATTNAYELHAGRTAATHGWLRNNVSSPRSCPRVCVALEARTERRQLARHATSDGHNTRGIERITRTVVIAYRCGIPEARTSSRICCIN